MPSPKVLINPDFGSTSGNTRVGWLPRARITKLPRSCLDPQTVKWTPSSQPWTNWRLMQMQVDFDPQLQSFRNRMVQWCAWTLFARRESQRFNRRFQSCIMGYWGFSLLPSYLRSYLRSYWRRIRSYWSFWMRSSWGSCGPCWLGAPAGSVSIFLLIERSDALFTSSLHPLGGGSLRVRNRRWRNLALPATSCSVDNDSGKQECHCASGLVLFVFISLLLGYRHVLTTYRLMELCCAYIRPCIYLHFIRRVATDSSIECSTDASYISTRHIVTYACVYHQCLVFITPNHPTYV